MSKKDVLPEWLEDNFGPNRPSDNLDANPELRLSQGHGWQTAWKQLKNQPT